MALSRPNRADRQARLPHVVVRCDREGADVLAVDAEGTEDAAGRIRARPVVPAHAGPTDGLGGLLRRR